ncbi:hypothetical protein [Erwinia typographi]|uniref:hypothetical protein n=1 Tax=Erwinia typographi TaxID=371042 RepID=UPI0006905217|nr:hypothetical protein [Erwinia typographi]
MTTVLNNKFSNSTIDIMKNNFLTAVRLDRLLAGPNNFDLNHHFVNKKFNIMTLDPPGMSTPLEGYWVPQGQSCVIPANPGTRKFVFTPDFSGCSLMVDQIDRDKYRVYHVQGGSNYYKEEYEQNKHGLGLAASMVFNDYGDANAPRAFALMKFEHARWWIYYQYQYGIGINFSNERFNTIGPQTVRGFHAIMVKNLHQS